MALPALSLYLAALGWTRHAVGGRAIDGPMALSVALALSISISRTLTSTLPLTLSLRAAARILSWWLRLLSGLLRLLLPFLFLGSVAGEEREKARHEQQAQ